MLGEKNLQVPTRRLCVMRLRNGEAEYGREQNAKWSDC
jgi:hypothetical protein